MDTIAYIRATGIYSDSRATKEIMDLADLGKQIIVLGWDRDGKGLKECAKIFEQKKNVVFRMYEVRAIDGIGIKSIHKLIGWMHWIKKQLNNIHELKAIHACDLDAGWPAYCYCKKNKKTLIYDIYDYYIDSHTIPKEIVDLVEKLEIKTINYASATIICTEERREQIKKSNPQKVVVVHNSPDIDIKIQNNNVYDFAYCGGLSNARLIGPILDNYVYNTDLRVCFAGYGENQNKTIELEEKYERFIYKGTVSYNEVIEIESKAKCLSAIYDPAFRNHRLCAPNKFYEAIALGKPIIVCKGTGIDRIVEKYNLGIVINYDAIEFYNALRLLKNSPEICYEMGENGRKLYEKEYRWRYMRTRLLDAYNTIIHDS